MADHVPPLGRICFSGRVLTQNPDLSHNDLVSADTFQISQGQVIPDFQISAAWPALAVCWQCVRILCPWTLKLYPLNMLHLTTNISDSKTYIILKLFQIVCEILSHKSFVYASLSSVKCWGCSIVKQYWSEIEHFKDDTLEF